jgi:hypothetical protein
MTSVLHCSVYAFRVIEDGSNVTSYGAH